MSKYENNPVLDGLSLGQATEYRSDYNPSLLQAVPRSLNRKDLAITEDLPFSGGDLWHAYELSWLNERGKPVVALARVFVDAQSPNIIESKSFKLYLNSLNQSRFSSFDEVQKVLVHDLSNVAGWAVEVELIQPDDIHSLPVAALEGHCIDGQDIGIDGQSVSETLHSHLLKSNCLITDQPDWASVVIRYEGPKIDEESLLRYLISFRLHNEFHEQCVERIYTDLMMFCKPDILYVQALYTRRGGLDINPYRTNDKKLTHLSTRVNRQ